jgi:hypothetical protein
MARNLNRFGALLAKENAPPPTTTILWVFCITLAVTCYISENCQTLSLGAISVGVKLCEICIRQAVRKNFWFRASFFFKLRKFEIVHDVCSDRNSSAV